MYDTASFILSLVEVGLTRAFIVYVRPLEKDSIYFKHRKYQNLFAFSSISAEYLQKIGFFISLGSVVNVRKVRWVLSYVFCSRFHTLSSSAKIRKSVKI